MKFDLRQLQAFVTLADTAASEHMTAIMAHGFFERREVLEHTDPRIRAMYAWHSIEEVEHKAVCFDVLTKVVKAGRRTYFFDVRATRGDDYFLTITESRKMQNPDGSFSYDRHKIFLYKEDFAKFSEGLSEAVDFIRRSKPEFFERKPEPAEG